MKVLSGAFTLFLLLTFLVLPSLSFLRRALIPERPPLVAIENTTASGLVIWASTEPFPRPTGDSYLLARFGFAVEPNETVILPNDRAWSLVELYSLACTSLAEEVVDSTTHVRIEDPMTVSLVPGDVPANLAVAKPSTTCALVPFTPPPVRLPA
jgi:hypothetical protein